MPVPVLSVGTLSGDALWLTLPGESCCTGVAQQYRRLNTAGDFGLDLGDPRVRQSSWKPNNDLVEPE